MRKTLLAILGLALMLCACEKADDLISHRYPCRFYFFYQQHSTSLLFSAYRTAGMWVYVYTTGDGYTAVRHVYVQSNDGRTPVEDNVIGTEEEKRAPYLLGANSGIGLIVGCTNFSGPTAFDRVCPNCASLQALRWATNRQNVVCNACKREYSLETGGIVSGSNGDALMRYNCTFDGSRLVVGN